MSKTFKGRCPRKRGPSDGFTATTLFNPMQVARTLQSVIATDFERSTSYRAPWQSHFAKVQVDKLLKKFVLPNDGDDLDSVTFEKFLGNVERLRSIDLHIEKTRPSWRDSARALILHRARNICCFVLRPFTEEELFEGARHSNGATVGVSFLDTSLEAKWKYPVTVTDGCLPLLKRYLSWNQQLHEAIKDLNGCTQWYTIKRGSVAATVPKDREINRFIAKEPTGNMFLQQGAMALMYQRLTEVGLDLSSLPDYHRHLAWLGSLTGSCGTIDWSQASDCVLAELVEFLFPAQWSRLLNTLRSPVTLVGDTEVELPMISSMGNATTFPVETLVFWSLAVATLYTIEHPRTNSLIPDISYFSRVTVFGDDCILPSSACNLFIEVACSLGFIVNANKTFIDPHQGFRESCGGDYLRGVDVRPFFLKAPAGLKSSQLEAWLYVIGNGVLEKYFLYFGHLTYMYDKAFFAWYFDLFVRHKVKIKVVPNFFPDDAGLKIFPDLVRFLEHYEFELTPIRVNQHGTVKFNYLRNVYPEQLEVHDHLRYVSKLSSMAKRIVDLPCDTLRFIPEAESVRYLRKNSAYVTASAITCHLSF